MRILLLNTIFFVLTAQVVGQDFSNKGKDFWVGYGSHVRMYGANNQQMVLYISSTQATNFKVEIPGIGWTYNGTVAANSVTTTVAIPSNGVQDARLNQEGKSNKGIHITSDKAVVAYVHIYDMNVSGAGILFPTNTLGRYYVSLNYTQRSNEGNSYSFCFVVATEDNTTVEIIPSQTTLGGLAPNTVFSTQLNKGQVYNILSNNDLTGTIVRSVSTNTAGCKKIAVFSGSGKMNIAPTTNGSADNLIQQNFPINAWGKKYITATTLGQLNNFFRIILNPADPATSIQVNGVAIPIGSFVNGYYDIGPLSTTNSIQADKPIMVAQYTPSQGQYGNGSGPGDPEMIYLSPIEQTIDNITVFSTPNFLIQAHYINVIMKTNAVNSFTLDGANYAGNFLPVTQDPLYSYLRVNVSSGQHNLKADSGFNAIAYGFGTAESYGYSAGTNLRDLYQFVSIQNEGATVNFPASCKGTPFKLSAVFPYQPLSIKWLFNGLFADTAINNPMSDSSWVVNDKTLYRYQLPRTYILNNVGTFQISLIVNNPSADGCNGEQQIDYDLQVFDKPKAGFTKTLTGCINDPVSFADTSNGNGRTVTKWFWNFGDAVTGNTKNPQHPYTAAGSYPVKLSVITDVGCVSDTATDMVIISEPPIAAFTIAPLTCRQQAVTFTDQSTITTGTIVKWVWDFGDGSPLLTVANNNPVSHIYTTVGGFTVKLQVESISGCKSIVLSKGITIHPLPVVNFSLPAICLPAGIGTFNDQSTISDGSETLFTYAWDFGDGGVGTGKTPVHQFSGVGPYNVKLQVTSNNGCVKDTTKVLNTIYPQPKAKFTVTPEVCIGAITTFTDQSNGSGSAVTKWNWDFGNGQGAMQKDTTYIYPLAGTYNPKLFVTTDKGCVSDTATLPTVVNALPVANFNEAAIACEKRAVLLTDASVPNAGVISKWAWDFGDGGTSTIQNPPHVFNSAGSYMVALNVETSKGCKSIIFSKPININPLPVASFTMPRVCLDDPFAQFNSNSTIADSTMSQFSYLWNFGDANANPTSSDTAFTQNPTHKYSAVGNYLVNLKVTSGKGCSTDTTQSFKVNGSTPKADFIVNNAAALCSNLPVSITNKSLLTGFGSLVKVEIYWDYLNNPTNVIMVNNPVTDEVYTHKYADFGSPVSKTYEVLVIAYSGINCTNQKTATITVNASPVVTFASFTPVCQEVPSFTVNNALETTGLNGAGQYIGNGISSSGFFNPVAAGVGAQLITYKYVSDKGCADSGSQTLTVYPTPTADAGPDRFVLEGGFIQLDGKASGNNNTYLWTPPLAIDNPAILLPKVSPTTEVTYKLTVTSADGCTQTDEVLVKVLKGVKVPNVFSPNGDGINDFWEIQYLDSYPGCTIDVFNRYGQPVYRSVGYNKPGWNGTVNGKPLPVGVYYWIINPNNGRQQFNGSVTILR